MIRSDALAKALGTARYSQDLYPQHMLHGVVVRSPHARARVTTVDTRHARSMPGVVCVLGPQDVPDKLYGDVEPDEPILARDVRYLGQPVALVAAATRQQAQAAARRVVVAYDVSAPVLTLDAAMAASAPEVCDGTSNIQPPSEVRRGDIARVWVREDVTIVETQVRTNRVHQGYIELRSVLAEFLDDGRLRVVMSSQCPYQVRASLADIFDLALADVVVEVPTFGGGFGGKLHQGLAPHAVALARASGRPVQVVCPREEDFHASNPREAARVDIASAVTADGKILARRVSGYFDSGAYTIDTPYITAMGAMQACGPYDIDNVECAIHAVGTNLAPTGSFRSPSGPQMSFAIERHMDDIAARIGMDPMQLRRRNFVRPGSLGATGQTLDDPPVAECADRVAEQLQRWRTQAESVALPEGFVHGFGQAVCWWFTAPGASSVTIRLEEDGSATVHTGATEIGTGAVVSGLRQLVARALGIEPDKVRIVGGNTDAPPDFGSEGSRTLYGAGNAALAAVGDAKLVLAEHLNVAAADVHLADGQVAIRGIEGTRQPLGQAVAAAAAAGGAVIGKGRFQASAVEYDESSATRMKIPSFHEPTFHSQGAWVVIDRRLGKVAVKKYVAAHDVGFVVDPVGLRGQIEGGIVQGIGQALYEMQQIDSTGRVRNANLVDYRLPTAGDVPDEIVIHPVVSRPSSEGPCGAKGIGEAPVILPGAVLAAAIQDGTGLRLTELPMDPIAVTSAVSISEPSY